MPPELARRTAETIGVAAVRYFLLKFTRTKIIAFDIDEALSFEGESGPYLQYSVVRAQNIFAKLGAREGLSEQALLARLGDVSAAPLDAGEEGDELWNLTLEASRLEEVTAHDPRTDDAWFDRYCPVRNVGAAFPPTVLVHGTDDTDVPHDESAKMVARFAAAGIEHRFISLPGVGHGFAGAQPADAEAAELAVAEFLAERLQ